jgi:hypothetical protein
VEVGSAAGLELLDPHPAVDHPRLPDAGVGERDQGGAGTDQLPWEGHEQPAHVDAAPSGLAGIAPAGVRRLVHGRLDVGVQWLRSVPVDIVGTCIDGDRGPGVLVGARFLRSGRSADLTRVDTANW